METKYIQHSMSKYGAKHVQEVARRLYHIPELSSWI